MQSLLLAFPGKETAATKLGATRLPLRDDVQLLAVKLVEPLLICSYPRNVHAHHPLHH